MSIIETLLPLVRSFADTFVPGSGRLIDFGAKLVATIKAAIEDPDVDLTPEEQAELEAFLDKLFEDVDLKAAATQERLRGG